MDDIDLDELAEGLSEFAAPQKAGGRSAMEQRIIAGFEEVERFVEQHGRLPEDGEGRDIFERLYAVRLGRLRTLPECRAVLKDVDSRGLLGPESAGSAVAGGASSEEPDLDELSEALSELVGPADDVTRLVHVRPIEERKAAEEVAQRQRCEDFETFRPVFEQAQSDLNAKTRQTIPFRHGGGFNVGDMFILDGQMVYVAHVGEVVMKDFGREDSRLRVIFDNGTESNLLLRSLQRALYKGENGRRILPAGEDSAPLFADTEAEGDSPSGYIYVLRSKSDNPFVAQFRSTLHKIGVTGGDVKTRIANANKDATYLLADVEIVQTYKLIDLSRKKAEELLHKFLAPGRMDVTLKDRFGFDVAPREWFIVPLNVIDEAVQKLRDGTLHKYRYDRETAKLLKA